MEIMKTVVRYRGSQLKIGRHMDAIKCLRFSRFGRHWLRIEGRRSRAPKIHAIPVPRGKMGAGPRFDFAPIPHILFLGDPSGTAVRGSTKKVIQTRGRIAAIPRHAVPSRATPSGRAAAVPVSRCRRPDDRRCRHRSRRGGHFLRIESLSLL